MSSDEIVDDFDAFANAPEDVRAHQAEHAVETEERWGGTDAHRESTFRARGYGTAEWERIREEADANEARMAELLAAGADPEGEEAMTGAEAMRSHISRWFYECSHRVHVGLADVYEADPRFAAHYDERAPGLAAFVAAAVRANAIRAWDRGGS